MGGKTSQSTSTVSIPPEVLARYNAVNARAEEVAKTPFQQYGGQFVAGLTPTQQAGIQNTSAAANQAQPYYGAATGLALAGTMPISPGGLQTSQYMNPFTEAVAAPTYQALRQQQGQERAQQQAQAIKSGAFGGDRAGLERANLARQQNLATAQAIAPIFQQGYGQALQTAQQQQGVGLAAEQANRAAFQQGAQQIAGLGTGAQQAALQGAQAQLAAGTAEQQTNQADLTARYQQFLQERGYPFQTAQFLANIAMGTGALSGSTTTSTQPAGFFSDERLKEDIKRVGETDDGLPIYSYRYKGDKKTQIGLIAQDVEKEKPEAVGLAPAADGKLYKTVDYKKATEDRPHREYGGGLDVNSMGGAVFGPGEFAGGGVVDPTDMKSILAAIGKPIDVYGNKGILGGDSIGGGGIVPTSGIAIPSKLATASNVATNRQTGLSDVVGNVKGGIEAYKMGKAGLIGTAPTATDKEGSAGLIGGQGKLGGKNIFSEVGDFFKSKEGAAHGGLIVGRHHYDEGGEVEEENDLADLSAGTDQLKADPNEDRARVPSSALPAGVLESGSKQQPALPVAQTQKGRSGMEDIADIAKTAASIYAMSDERMKHHKERIGYLYDGQPVYSYDFGDGKTQLGLLAQKVEREHPDAVMEDKRGLKLVDYKAATQDAAKRKHFLEGGDVEPGLVPPADIPEDYETRLAKTMQAIKRIESGGRSDALGPATRTGDRAHGLYQVMGANVPSWTEAALGRRMTPEEFRNDPEAQEATAKHRMGLYLKQYNDPAQVASMWFSGRPIEKAGEAADVTGTTVPRYISMFNKYYGGAESPDLPSRGAKEAEYREAPKEDGLSLKGVGDTVTSDRFLVPFLSFVGSTLASQRPTLGGALGEGIVGGVTGYQQNKKLQAELAKGALDIIKEQFSRSVDDKGNTVWYNKYTGKKATGDVVANTYAGLLKARGVDPAAYGFGAGSETGVKAPSAPTAPGAVAPAGGAAAPAEGKPAAGAEPAKGETVKSWMDVTPDKVNLADKGQKQVEEYVERYADYYGLSGERNPAKMRADIAADMNRAKALSSTGDAEEMREAQLLRQTAEEKQKRLDGYIRDAASLQVGKNAELAKSETQSIGKRNEEADRRMATYDTARGNLNRLAQIYSRYEPGRASAIKADLESWFKGTIGYVPKVLQGNAPNYDEALKLALAESFTLVGDNNLSRSPKAALDKAVQTVPNPSLDPAATYSLIGRTIGEMDYLMAKDKAWAESGGNIRPYMFEMQYREKVPDAYNKAVRGAFGQIPVGKNVPPSQVEDIRKQYGDFTPAGGGTAGRSETSQPAPQAPAVPEVGAVQQGYRFKGGNPASPSSWEKVQ
jgi:hypothetical protein